MQVKTLNTNQAAEKFLKGELKVVDIRDPASFNQSRIKTAVHLDNSSVDAFLTATDKDAAILVYCYSGFASQNVALYLEGQGYKEVYSLDGGFNSWQLTQPDLCE